LPSKGNNIKSHINNKSFTFNVFLLLENYYNDGSLNLVMDLATDSNDLHFMVLLMHSACTQPKCINTKNKNINVKYINIGNRQVQNTTKHDCAYNTSTQTMNKKKYNKTWYHTTKNIKPYFSSYMLLMGFLS
jgi:hypothetical protein